MRSRTRGQRMLLALITLVVGALGIGRVVPASSSGFTTQVTNDRNTASSGVFSCRNAANALSAYLVYPFSEVSGTTATDVSGNGRDGTYAGSGVGYGAAGPCGDAAITLDGSTGAVSSPGFLLGLLSFSEAIWFRTNVGGGQLIGVGSSATGASTTHDRSMYLSDSGAVNFELNQTLAPAAVLTSPGTYKDGAWHLAVATSSTTGMTLYVDGVAVRSGGGLALGLSATSYWRIGYDSLSGVGSTAPSNAHFTGSLAYASVYTRALTASEVASLWAARS